VKILLLAATPNEVQSLKDKLIPTVKLDDPGIDRFRYREIIVDIIVSGIGMVAKAYQLGKQLQKEKYDLALNIGIAGSFKNEIPIGSVVNVVQDQFSEMGAEDGDRFIGITEMNFKEFDTHPYTKGILINDTDFADFGLDELTKVKGITSNTIHGCQKSISDIITKFNPDIETMGGAAFLFACMSEEIPHAQIRSISNYVEVRDRSKWKVEQAIEQLTNEVLKILEYLSNNKTLNDEST
jgi:futalosine hydrolase